MSEETKTKLSVAHKGKKLSEEHKDNIAKGQKGKILSEDHKKKIGNAQLGDKNHMFGKTGDKSPRFGKKASLETKKKLSESKKGKKYPKLGISRRKKIICLNTNIVYDSVKKASLDLGISASGISSVASGKYKQTNGFRFKYL